MLMTRGLFRLGIRYPDASFQVIGGLSTKYRAKTRKEWKLIDSTEDGGRKKLYKGDYREGPGAGMHFLTPGHGRVQMPRAKSSVAM